MNRRDEVLHIFWLLSLFFLLPSIHSQEYMTEKYGYTEVTYRKVNYSWIIADFRAITSRMSNQQKIESTYFFPKDEENNLRFKLTLSPSGYSESAKNHVSLYIMFESNSGQFQKLPLSGEISILDRSLNKKYTRTFKDAWTEREAWLGFGKFIKKDEVMNPFNKVITENDYLMIYAEVFVVIDWHSYDFPAGHINGEEDIIQNVRLIDRHGKEDNKQHDQNITGSQELRRKSEDTVNGRRSIGKNPVKKAVQNAMHNCQNSSNEHNAKTEEKDEEGRKKEDYTEVDGDSDSPELDIQKKEDKDESENISVNNNQNRNEQFFRTHHPMQRRSMVPRQLKLDSK